MNTVQRIKSICKERKIPISRLESDLGFGNAYISGLKKGTVPDDRLKLISEYLGLSMNYLITGKEKESAFTVEMAKIDVQISNQSKRLKEYMLKLAELPKDKQENILNLIDMLSEE